MVSDDYLLTYKSANKSTSNILKCDSIMIDDENEAIAYRNFRRRKQIKKNQCRYQRDLRVAEGVEKNRLL